MGLLTDILKEIPQAAVLKEKIASIEAKYAAADTENAILKDDLRKANAEIAKMKEQIDQLTHKDSELHAIEIKILQYLGAPNYEHHASALSDYVGEKLTRVEYHLGNLERDGYITHATSFVAGAPTTYFLTQKGREYLVKNDLLL
jgi:hypothetical protein